MKLFKLAAIAAIALCAVVMIVPDAFAAAAPLASHVPHLDFSEVVLATLTAVQLRAQKTQLIEQARAKEAELKDGMPDEQVRTIMADHQKLLDQAAALDPKISEAERAEEAARSAAAAPPAAQQQDVGAATRAEITRIATIRDIGQRAQMEQTVIDTAIANATTPDAFRAEAFNVLAARSNATPTNPSRIEIVRDEDETRQRGMRDAIVARLARSTAIPGQRVEIPEHARSFGEMGFAEMAAECVGYRGNLRTARQVHDVLERAFHSTSDFPGIFVDAMNVRLLARYQVAQVAYRRFCALYTTTDFRPTHVVRAGDFPALQPVNEDGEIKGGTFAESKEIFRVYPYGVKFNVSRQMIINDSLRAIDQMLNSSGERVADWENTKAFEKLAEGSGAGPTLATDNKRVFHTDHGNLAGAGAVPGITTVGAGRAAMMKQTTLNGIKANFTPVTIMTGPDHLLGAEQLVTSITPAQGSNAVPDWVKRLVPVGDANISGNPWYLFADPTVAPCFVYGYLEGFEGPRLASDEVFDVQGLRVKLEHDFGVEGIDFRGGYRNPGANPA